MKRSDSSIKLGIIMDPIAQIRPQHDSSFAMLLAAQRCGWRLYYMEQKDLCVDVGIAAATMREIKVMDDAAHWFSLGEAILQPLTELNVILMRKDPPVDQTYLYTTQLLDLAEQGGVLVVNKPQSLRDFNEKLFINHFPELCPPTLITQNAAQVQQFLKQHQDIVLKPLHGMGGMSIFRVRAGDPNLSVIIETLSNYGSEYMLAQKYVPAINAGDKRILLIDGEAVPYAYARFAPAGEMRANIAAGGRGEGMALNARERFICQQIAPMLKAHGIFFAGIDVIGDYLTEINITSPTCIRELDQTFDLDIAGQLLQCIAERIA